MHFTSFVSSAKMEGSADSTKSVRSFMKIKNNKGPRTLPWGTGHLNQLVGMYVA